ncbi:MAG TPA: non-ribosomal peptide synthase/polyketide synthase [Thermoanaerobaculia bacterium]|nr:non-ribosomal peptide synthase/polyketide synthase [Thermoanaerobaculia bacterium]
MIEPTVWSAVRLATFAGVLRARAAERPEQVAFTFLADGEIEAGRLTYAALDRAAAVIAAALREAVAPGERALLLYPPGLDFIAAFFGCLYAGVVAVPAYPPRPNDRSQSRLRAIARDAEARAALTTSALLAGAQGLAAVVPELGAVRWIATDLLDTAAAPGEPLPEPDPEAIAFLQYTSGSTAEPKGVMVTHANLLHNEQLIGEAFGMDEESVVVGWLPLYHDMGLIGNVLQPLHAGARCVLMPPISFLQRPLRWLEAISRHRGTTSGGPNFAYELCLRKASPEALVGLDLASWQVAFNGAEPVRASTLERFAETFAPCGFRPQAIYPCYGLAEATLFVTGGGRGRQPRRALLDAEALERNEAVPAALADGTARLVVGCGQAWGGQRVVVADPETGTACPAGAVGEIWVSGPSVARGYWRNQEATERDFNAFLLIAEGHSEGPFLRTGDLGFVADGELYITGRLKDLVILRGRNHYPQDLELTAEASHPDLRPGNGAAFSVEVSGEERLVLVLEVERRRRKGFEEVAEAVRRAVAAEHEVQVFEVVLIRPGALPKTSSGKVQRSLCRRLYLADELPVVGRSALTEADRAPELSFALTRDGLAALEPRERREMLAAYLREQAAAVLGIRASGVPLDRPLTSLGLDSLSAVELKASVEAALGLALPLSELVQGIAISELTHLLLAGIDVETAAVVQPPRALALAGAQPLSSGQRALWFLERLAPESGAYNVAVAARVREGLDSAALCRAVDGLTARHEALRTVFRSVDGEPVQRAVPGLRSDTAVEDARSWSEAELRGWLETEAWRPFDLETGPPLRLRIYERDAGERVLLFAVHHLVADFWSLAVVARELAALYLQETGGPPADLTPPALQYSDFVHWQGELLSGLRGEQLWDYWREELRDLRDLELPIDRPRPPFQSWRGLSRAGELSADLAGALRRLAAAEGATLFTTLLAAFQAQLGRYTGQDAFAVGSPTAGRGSPEWNGVVGYFVNPVALRVDLAGDPSFRILLERSRRTVLAALEHAEFPMVLLAERLRPVRDPARPPLFQGMLALQQRRGEDDFGLPGFALGEEGARVRLGSLELESLALGERRALFEISLNAAELPAGGLGLSLEVSSDLFDATTAERMLGHFQTLLEAAVADPDRAWSDLPLLTSAEREELLRDWSVAAEPSGPTPELPLHELVALRAERSPAALAVVAGEERLSYGELMAKARTLARRLRRLGVGPEIPVALCVERSADLVIGALGILEAGGVYLPLDPDYSPARLAFVLQDAGAAALVTQSRVAARLPETAVPAVLLDAAANVEESEETPAVQTLPENLAYLIYTSGSTGRPKGVAVTHSAAAEHCLTWGRIYRMTEHDRVLQFPSAGFDASLEQIFSALLAGATLVLRGPEPWGPRELTERIAELGLTIIDLPTAFFSRWVQDAGDLQFPGGLRLIGIYGEELRREIARRWSLTSLACVPLLNCYGPTEAVVSATLHELRPEEAGAGPVPIGRPLPGRVARIHDAFANLQPAGMPGELCLGGLLARGYLGRPDLTAERFVPDSSGSPGSRLYRTGDLARRRTDGTLEFLGRRDDQLKIRGFRVEPGEIESVLTEHPDIREAAVLAVGAPGEERRLVAFVAPALPEDVRAFLRERLPDFMIPAAWAALPALPLNANGKVDRGELARHASAAEIFAETGSDAPRTPEEELLAGIWAGLLGQERVGIHDDFFALGGHSLLAIRVVAQVSRVFGVDLPLSALFQAPTVAGLAEQIGAVSETRAAPPIRPLPRSGSLPLSFAQRRMWFLEQLEPGVAVYNIPGEVRLAGRLDLPALAAALGEISARHEALRTVFVLEGGEAVQRVEPPGPQALPMVDLSPLPDGARQDEAERRVREEARRPFDLVRGPVWRALLLRWSEEEHRLLVTFHHIAADGWSVGVFLDELSAAYGALARRAAPALPDLPVQYPDFALWQREWLQGKTLERELAYWRGRLAGLPVLELPADRPRPAVRDPRGAVRSLAVPSDTVAAVTQLARREGLTLFMTLLGVFQTLLARLSGELAVPVGSPVANRRRPEVEGLIGLFVNTLVLDVRIGDDPALRDFMARVREACLDAYAHQDLPFERLVEELQPSRELSQNPLFQVVLVLEEPLPARTAGELVLEPVRSHSGTAKFDLVLAVSPRADGGWDVFAEYSVALFDPATIDRLLRHWQMLVEGAAAADPAVRLSGLPLLTAAERQQVFAEWNDTGAPYPSGLCLHHLVAAQAARTPDAEAVVGEAERLTYRELLLRSGRLARFLRGQGVGPEVRVGICLERTPDLIAAILGVLQAGGAYVPLDPAYPQERLEVMLIDSQAQVLLTESALAGRLAFFAAPTLLLDVDCERIQAAAEPPGPAREAGGGNMAYVIFTSGSTGRPKGVAIEHRSAVTFVHWSLETFPWEDLAGSLAATSVCFDVSIFEIFVPLSMGGKVILAPNVTGLPQLKAIREVKLVTGVPSPMAELVDRPLPAGLRTVKLAGEPLKPDLVERVYAHPQVERVYNLYGPTEDTTYSTCARVPKGAALVTIGRPIANTQARVLDANGNLAPVAVPGELFLAGEGLSRGYLGRPDLTADRYVPDPFGPPGARMYRTGDRVRVLSDGQLDCLGRLDHQVKLHGIRIELGEIEAALEQHPAVRQAVAALRSDGTTGSRLVGYLVAEEGAATGEELVSEVAACVRGLLPGAMVPTVWMVLEALPLSPNGKVDRRALPAPSRAGQGGTAAPRNQTEETLAALWAEVLGLESLGIHDDFFERGGHSLLAVRAAFRTGEVFGVEVPVSALFQAPTVAEMTVWLAHARGEAVEEAPIPAAPPEGPYPLSFAQQRLWLIDRLEPGSALYNLLVPLRLAGRLEVKQLGRALGAILRRHEPLRTVYSEMDGEPVQIVLPPPAAPPLSHISLAGLPEPARQQALYRVLQDEAVLPFDLQRGPVARFLLVELEAEEHVLAATFHHIATDGWSMGVFARELTAIYEAFVAGLPSLPAEPPLRYVDYALAQRHALADGALARQLDYWRSQLAGIPVLELPADRQRPLHRSPRGRSLRLDLPVELVESLSALGRSDGITPFMVLLAGFAALLARLSGQEDFGIGVPSAGRNRAETEGMIGFFVNTLVLRPDLAGDPPFLDLVRRVRDATVAAQAHQDVPFERLVEELQPERNPAVSPLFQALFSFLADPAMSLRIPGLAVELVTLEATLAKFDLSLAIHEWQGSLEGWLQYRTDIFDASTVERIAGWLLRLLTGAAADPSRRFCDLPLLAAAEAWQLTAEWNDTAADLPDGLCLHDLVALQMARTPDAPAVLFEDRQLTYRELDREARRLAGNLRRLGVGPEDTVGLFAERSLEMVAGLLGILRAGGAYVPLDPDSPAERLAWMVEGSGARVVVTQERLAGKLPPLPGGVRVLRFEESAEESEPLLPSQPLPDTLACVIFTSGSTGRPKGVALPHRGLVNRLQWAQQVYRLTAEDVVLQKANFGFDFAIWECFAPLIAGARLVVARPGGHQDASYLVRTIAGRGVTIVHFVPSMLDVLLREEGVEACASLRQVFAGGEALAPELRDRLLARLPVPLDNQYGPTEISIDTTRWVCAPGQDPRRVPLGRPIANARIHLLDRGLQTVPIGVAGELCVAGPGVARGYLGRPDLTAERFVPDPFVEGGRIYRTGDLARRMPDGNLEFLGRADQQVKVRGVRIEPGEIEAALLRHPAVAAAAVVADSGGARLVAHWVGRPGVPKEVPPAELREFLRRTLPESMVPSLFVRLESLPRTPSGKLDRRALPAPEEVVAGVARDAEGGPASPVAELLAGFFGDLLEVPRVGPRDDFFDLGGHSLLATQLASRVRAAFGVELPLAAVFEAPTPTALAGRLEEIRRAPGTEPPPPLIREEGTEAPLSFSQQRLWFLHQLDPKDAYHVPGALRLRGSLDEEMLERSLTEIVHRHEALRTVFHMAGSTPVQVVLPPANLRLPVVDLTALSTEQRETEAGRLLDREARLPFDLEQGPLVRLRLLRFADDERLLALVMHHIVSDAWSLGVLLRELGEVYRAFAGGESSRLPELPVQYSDFARWQRRWLAGEMLEREVAYWRRTLTGAPESLELPYDRSPLPGAETRGGRRPFELSAGLWERLLELARRDGWTPFMALLAGFQTLLSRYGNQEDVIVGSPIANRNRLELEGLIGFFTNTLALRLDLSGDPSFWELGRRVRASALEAYAHQDLPFEKLVEELAPDRHLARNPLFQTMLVLQRPPAPPSLPAMETELLDVDTGTAKFDLTLMLTETPGGAAGVLEYARDLFDEATVDRILGHLRTLLAAAGSEPGRRLSELAILTEAERAELLASTRPLLPEPPQLCVHDGVAAQAARTPGAVAVTDGADSLTYGELMARARRLARRLRELGVGPDVPVGLFLERSLDMAVALLGVLEAGGAYLSLDPTYPAERLRLMLEDAEVPVLVTHAPLAGAVPEGTARIVRVDELEGEDEPLLPPAGVMPEHLAYVIYTSGSTGRPKGVAMTHSAISAMLLWQLRTSAAEARRTLQFTSLSFDVSFQEIFSTWWAGSTLVLVADEVRRDPVALTRWMAEQRVERLFLPFVALQQVAMAAIEDRDPGIFPASLREVMSAGEQLHVTPQVAALFSRLPGAVLHNHYGPSETHAATWLSLAGDPACWPERPAIGLPVDHARVFLLDANLQPVPVGVTGEIWVGGAGLARGYQGRPDLTAERFLPDPFDWAEGWRPGDRLYRTGDLARRRADGVLEFLGRRDSQVKIRGHRIELFEVETALARHEAVQQAAVAVRGEASGARRLVAYVVLREEVEVPAFGELRAFLAESLPDPMVPTAWARLDSLPLTATGKLDREALSRIAPEEGSGDGEPFVRPRTPAEELLAEIWSTVLAVEHVGLYDDFFQLGGHSLLATQVASRVREAFGVHLPLRRIFEASTLAGMAAAILDAEGAAAPAPPIRRAPRAADLPLSFGQERLWFLDRLQPGSSAYNVPLAVHAEGRLDARRLAAALSALARRHEVLRTVFAERGGEPVQVVMPAAEVPLPSVDLRDLPAASRQLEAQRLTAEEAVRPFDLARGPLLRCLLLQLDTERALLVLNLHHVVTDGWSMGVLVREINALYAGSSPPELPVQYADFAAWQRRWLAGETLDRQLAWWRERLRGAPSALELPADHPRPPVLSQRGAEHRFTLAGELSHGIAELARREAVTPFMVLAAGLFALLLRLTGQRDLTVGSPIANRGHLETEALIGFFVNTLVLRADLSRTASFRDLLRQVREASLGAYAHQDLPFEKLVDELQPDRDLSRSPLFQVALALQNAPLPAVDLGAVRLVPEEILAGVAKFDLSFVFVEVEEGRLDGLLQYATDLFAPATAARYARHLCVMLGELVARPRGRLGEVPLLSAAERQQILREWNDTRSPLVRDLTIHRLFEERADLRPEALAAVWDGESLAYGGLEARANRLAWLLRDLGAGPGMPVGIWLSRSLDMIVAVLATLKAGSHYLPLDASWPAERVEAILATSRAPIVVTRSELLPQALEVQWRTALAEVVCLDVDTPRPPAEPVDAGEVRALWDFVAARAVDRVSAGGFVSSYTGLPFSEPEVDEYRDRVLSLAAPWLRPDARVLEIGCGSGLILWEMATRVACAVGVDPSELTQERNRAYAVERGLTNVELLTGFAHEIDDLAAGEFDLIVLASTVQFFPGPLYLERIVEQGLRRLAPGGALLIADVPDARRRDEFQESLGVSGKAAPRRMSWFDEDLFHDVAAALPEAGEVSVLHRCEGFANELRFRYDVLLTRCDGERPTAARRKRLWTGWHAEHCPSRRPPSPASPDDSAYVIHTSGSTGQPKGIGVQHRPAVALIRWVNGTFDVGPSDRLLFTTSLGFDLSVYDIFGTLAAGGTIHVAPEAAVRDPVRLAAMLREESVTLWDSAPAALQQLAPLFPARVPAREEAIHAPSPLRLVLLSGDWIPVSLPDQVRAAFPGARVISLGGATEATVWSNWYPIDEVDPRWPSIPYGRPIDDARYYVLDEGLSPSPVSVAGDLYIGGGVLSLGYIHQPDLTAAQFLPDPFAGPERKGARMYCTGDRARCGADGNLEFLGRIDQQVKVRGYRIELGEIEVALSRHPGVREAVVLARADFPGEKRLVGYVIPSARPAPTAAGLREFLLEILPEYMVPWAFVELEAFPVTTNGKLDRAALPAPQPSVAGGGTYVAPRNELERDIARVWREVLQLKSVGVNDNFFESGGSSLLIVKLHSRLKEALGRDVPVMELFRHTTIDALARKLAEDAEEALPDETRTGQVRERARSRQSSLRQLREARTGRRGRTVERKGYIADE